MFPHEIVRLKSGSISLSNLNPDPDPDPDGLGSTALSFTLKDDSVDRIRGEKFPL